MITHDYYDHKDADRDINVVFPLDRLRELEQEGIIKALSPLNFGLMSHVIGRHIRTLTGETAPEIAKRLQAAGADIVLLTPAWGICNQTVGLVQREIEKAGIPTIGISIVREYTEKVTPPRSVFLRWPYGHPLGEPFNVAQQRAVLIEAFKNLYSITKPGTIVDLPLRWRRESYDRYRVEELREL
jgi:D-proline reductase (dithiol) PrdB